MAREYGTIDCDQWDDPYFNRLPDDAKLLLCYLKTCKHANPSGCFVVKVGYIVEDLRWESARVEPAFAQLMLKPFVFRDLDSQTVLIEGQWSKRGPENPNVATHAAKTLMALPDTSLKARAIDALKAIEKYRTHVNKIIGEWTYTGSQALLPLSLPQLSLPAPVVTKLVAESPPVKAPADKKGSRLTADWHPPTEYREYAISKGYSESEVDATVIKFVRYWTSPDANKPVKKDWYRTWCNWIDSEIERRPKKNGNGHANGTHVMGSSGPPWALRMESWYRNRTWFRDVFGPEPGEPGCKVPPEFLAPQV